MDIGEVRLRYVELRRERDEVSAQLDRIKDEMRTLEDEIKLDFERTGMESCRVNGMTIYINRQLWASAKDGDHDRLCAALAGAGFGDMIKTSVNTQSLSALVREHDAAGDDLPGALKEAVEVAEVFSVRTRKS